MIVEVGSSIKGTILKIADYGAIVRIANGQTGLVHISEIADTYVRDVREYVAEGDEVMVKVLRVNNKGRFELSLKRCEAPQLEIVQPVAIAARRNESRSTAGADAHTVKRPACFEDRLSRFLKDSEERQHDLKRHLDAKRGRK